MKNKRKEKALVHERKNTLTRRLAPLVFIVGLGIGAFILFAGHGHGKDDLNASQIMERQKAYERVNRNAVFSPVQIERAEELDRAVDSMNLPQLDKQALLGDLQEGKIDIVWVEMWDDVAEDGDVVSFQVGKYSQTVPLKNTPSLFAVPLPRGTSSVSITGLRDGGGGITAAIRTSGGISEFPLLREGETLMLGLK